MAGRPGNICFQRRYQYLMQATDPYKIRINKNIQEDDLLKGTYISIIHADRIPPHIGMIFNQKYHSLSIKGNEIDLSAAVLLKNSKIRKIPSLFVKLNPHPTFSNDYLNEHFTSDVQQFQKVQAGKTTCLSPVKLFFEEAFGLSMQEINYIFDLLPLLEEMGLIESVSSICIEQNEFQLPFYSYNEINKGIENANIEIAHIRKNSPQFSSEKV